MIDISFFQSLYKKKVIIFILYKLFICIEKFILLFIIKKTRNKYFNAINNFYN